MSWLRLPIFWYKAYSVADQGWLGLLDIAGPEGLAVCHKIVLE
jgi:hypothetical protein